MVSLATLRRWSVLVLLAFVVFAVLWRGGKSLDATWLLSLLAGGMTFLAWAPGGNGHERTVRPFLWYSLVLFILWTIASYLASTTRNYGLDEVLRDTSLVLLFLYAGREAHREGGTRFLQQVGMVLAGSAIGATLLGFAIYIFQPVSRFVGTFFDHRFHTDYWPNAWAEFLLIAWPFLLIPALEGPVRRRWTAAAALGGLLSALLLSFSRGAMIAAIGQIAIVALAAGLFQIRQRSLRGKTIFSTLVITSGLAVGLFLIGNTLRSQFYDVESLTRKATFSADEGTSSINERSSFWQQSLQLAQKRPFLGWGPYSFRFVQPRLQEHVLATSDHPHNVFLKIAMERGIPVAVLYALIIAACMGFSVVCFLRRPSWFVALPLTAVAGVIAHNLIDYNLQFVGIALPFWLLLGILAPFGPTRSRLLPLSIVRGVEVSLACLLLIVTVLEGRYLVLSSLGRHTEAAGRTEEASGWYERSVGEWFSRDMHLSHARLLMDLRRHEDAKRSIDRYLAENAEDARAWKLAGDLALKQGEEQTAMGAYERSYELGGKYNVPATVLALASRQEGVNGAQGKVGEEEFRTLFHAYSAAVLKNAHFIALSDSVEHLIALGEVLARMSPQYAQEYQEKIAAVRAKATEVRAAFAARPPGMLW